MHAHPAHLDAGIDPPFLSMLWARVANNATRTEMRRWLALHLVGKAMPSSWNFPVVHTVFYPAALCIPVDPCTH